MYDGLDDELQQMDEREQDAPTLVAAVHLDDPISTLDLQPLSLVQVSSTIHEVLDLMKKNKVGCLLVEKDERLVGIFTERDVIRRVAGKGLDYAKATVGEHMTRGPDTLRMEDSIAHALNHMYDRGYRHVPIVASKHKPVGFVSMRDIVNHLAAYYRKEILNVPPRPVRKGTQREGG